MTGTGLRIRAVGKNQLAKDGQKRGVGSSENSYEFSV